LEKLSKNDEPLENVTQRIYFDRFRDLLEEALPSTSGTNKGRRLFMDCVFMFKTILMKNFTKCPMPFWNTSLLIDELFSDILD
jgi:hypothetical protein